MGAKQNHQIECDAARRELEKLAGAWHSFNEIMLRHLDRLSQLEISDPSAERQMAAYVRNIKADMKHLGGTLLSLEGAMRKAAEQSR